MIQHYTARLAALAIAFLVSYSLAAHTGSVRGIVLDGKTGKPLDGANIYLLPDQSSSVSNTFGQFLLRNVSPGPYTVSVGHIGYETATQSVVVEDGISVDISITLIASDIRLNEVTINSVKAQPFSSISDVDLKLRPLNTSQDFMRLIPGLFTAQHQGGGKAEQMFLRGFDIDHGTDINVSVDDMPVNMVSHAHGQGYADLHFLIPELVKRIDFGKGPYQLDKGNFATAGFAAFKTFDELDNSFVKLEGGMYGYCRTVAGINLLNSSHGDGKTSAYLAGEYSYNRGYFDAPQNFNRLNLTGKFTTLLSAGKQLSITLSAFRSGWEASGQIPERAVREGIIGRFGELDREGGNTSRYNMNVQYLQSINEHSLFKSNVYVCYYDFDLSSNFTFFLKDPLNGDQIRQREKRLLAGYNARYVNDYHLGPFKTTTEAGLGFRLDNTRNSELSHTLNSDIVLERLAFGDISEANFYGYAGQTLYLLPQLVFNAGLRMDYFVNAYNNKLPSEAMRSSYTTRGLSPKAGLYYNFSNSARLYINYGTGFHSNDTRVVVAQQGKDVLPMAHSFDLGTVVKPHPRLLLSAALWMLDLQQEFVYVGDEAIVEPSGRTRRLGMDISLRYEFLKYLFLDADINYAHARARDEAEGSNYIPLAARLTSIGGLTYRKGAWGASLRYRHLGNRPANEDNSVVAKGYTVFDAALNYSLRSFEFGLQAQNVFNTAWNEAQFDTQSRLRDEVMPVSEIHFTPGTPFFVKLTAMYKF
ncbi:TonB-dependent receptor [Taibaiella chishuiensis]|uniref:Outer membrane receptor protein involved in Fe transport n=1 Tax=Taibaiella chishuiensis TaxID=1434707 RepID=A0A2P8D8P1_9BACT|nr:TonB-dependent receptor [Taibaiella chishuiensis]PSK93572.1 outer membrane receptor protein involved in Fe transport [Taibaiella chishuiensis]